MGKSSINGPFPMAMLNNQMVNHVKSPFLMQKNQFSVTNIRTLPGKKTFM